MANNHGFADGNKRTTVILMDLILTNSGYKLAVAKSDQSIGYAVEIMVLAVAQNHLSYDELVEWFNQRIRRRYTNGTNY